VMSDPSHELDPVEAALGRRAGQRELDEREPEWEAVARGELELDEALAKRRAAGDDEQAIERASVYFRPFDGDETAALVDGLLAQVSPPAATEAEVIPLRKPEPAPAKAEPVEPPKPKHDPGSSGFWWIPGGMLLAAAAAIVMWWVWPPNADVRSLTSEGGEQVAIADPLPTYVLETDGGLKQMRGETGGSEEPGRHRYQRETEFEWILRPKVDEPGDVGVRGFAFVDGGTAGLPLPALDELAQVAKSGAVRIKGTIEQLDLEPGRYTIALAVGRPADLPTQATDVHESAADVTGLSWQVRRIEIEIEE
jgi:hypothetical protein